MSLHFPDTKVSHLARHPNSLYSQQKEKRASPKQFVVFPPSFFWASLFFFITLYYLVRFYLIHMTISWQWDLLTWSLMKQFAFDARGFCRILLLSFASLFLVIQVLGVYQPFWGAFILFCCNICNFSRQLGVISSASKKVTVLVLGREGVTKSYLAFRSPSEMLY